MSISSRNLVRKALSFANPERIPRQLWLLPWATDHYPEEVRRIKERFPDDIVGSPGFLRQPNRVLGDPYAIGKYVDEWGCIFENRQKGVIGEVKQPFIDTWEKVDTFSPPLTALSVDSEQVNQFCANTDRFVLAGCCPRPFERLQFLRGSMNLYLDLGENSSEFQNLLFKVHEFYLNEFELWAKTNVDGLMFMDDWGAQQSLLISPKQWRKYFKPLYQEYIDIAHQYGKFVFMHSDGYIADIIPDLVEMGLDALNSQLFIMDIENLGRQFAGKLTFWGEIDRQHILRSPDVDFARQAVRRVYSAFWRLGGCIAQCEFSVGARPDNVWTVYETWEMLAV